MYRMTNRQLDLNQTSPFLENTLKPLQSLQDQKMFATLSPSLKYKLFETVLSTGLKNLSQLLDDIISDERKMHESLKKYKKDYEGSGDTLSDFDKMQVQIYIDMRALDK